MLIVTKSDKQVSLKERKVEQPLPWSPPHPVGRPAQRLEREPRFPLPCASGAALLASCSGASRASLWKASSCCALTVPALSGKVPLCTAQRWERLDAEPVLSGPQALGPWGLPGCFSHRDSVCLCFPSGVWASLLRTLQREPVC